MSPSFGTPCTFIYGVYWCQYHRFDVLFSYFISQFINVLCWNTYINDNAPITLKMGFLLAVEPSYSSVKQWLSARPVVCHHVPLFLETKYDNIKKALGYFWDIFPTWKQIWQNHKGIGMFLKYFSNLEINMIKSKGLWDILRQRKTTTWYKMPLGYFEAKDEQQHDIRSSSLSQNMKNMKPRNHERQ